MRPSGMTWRMGSMSHMVGRAPETITEIRVCRCRSTTEWMDVSGRCPHERNRLKGVC